MQPLDKNFLTTIARKYDLSAEQQEVFVELFSTGKSPQEVAEVLHISHSALRTRMSGVYNKFSFTDKKPNGIVHKGRRVTFKPEIKTRMTRMTRRQGSKS